MTLRPLACALLLAAAPLAAQVGFPPDKSPYEDLRGRQALTVGIGSIAPERDPAGVGLGRGAMLTGRYELQLAAPLWLLTRVGLAPSLERTVKDPLLTGAARIVGTDTRPFFLWDAGFGLNLTGNKSWHRVVPQLHGGLGVVSDFSTAFDVGGYRFGTKFSLNYGLGLRINTRSRHEIHVDLTRAFWKYKYPDAYGGNGSSADSSILGARPLTGWSGNTILQVGVSRFFFR